MAADRFHQGKIAGGAGDPLAFLAIAGPDDLADPLAERPSLVLELRAALPVGAGEIVADLLEAVHFDAQ